MKFLCYTNESCRIVDQLVRYLKRQDILLCQSQLKINHCPAKVHLIGGNTLIKRDAGMEAPMSSSILELHETWSKYLRGAPRRKTLPPPAEENLLRYGKRATTNGADYNNLVYKFDKPQEEQGFFILLRGDKQFKMPIFELIYLSHFWQLESVGFPLHASAVIHHEGIYLFSGPSGTGKSTVATISENCGNTVLDEDMVVVYNSDNGRFSANAWGYSTMPSCLPIRGFFYLVKDHINSMKPLPKHHASRKVWEQSFHIPGPALPGEMKRKLFTRSSEFARNIPGYELHFRKSPDFWKLIDAEIPFD